MSTPLDLPSRTATHPGSLALLQQLRAFKAEMKRRFPLLPDPAMDTWPLLEHDALALYDFLETLSRQSVAIDIGTFTGLSSFCLALNPKISRVVSVDPNPLLCEQINEQSAVVGKTVDDSQLKDLRVLDVARQLLTAFPEAAVKIEIVEGVVADPSETPGARLVNLSDYLRGEDVVALVDGLHTRDGVRADLEAIFDEKATAVVILDDCRHAWGPYVQAGIADFLQQRAGAYVFTLLADLSSSFAQSNLGFVYAIADADDIERTFRTLQGLYASFDPLAMLAREEELHRIIVDAQERLDTAVAELEELRRGLLQMERSLSWKLTKPLRFAKRALPGNPT